MTVEPFYITLASSLATHMAGNLLDATTRRVREKFLGDDKQQALIAALQEGLETSLGSFHLEKVNEDHFKSLFEDFLSNPNVVDEFTHLIDPRPDTRINIELIRREFHSAGFDPETLAYFEFDTFIHLFAEAFYNSAAKQ